MGLGDVRGTEQDKVGQGAGVCSELLACRTKHLTGPLLQVRVKYDRSPANTGFKPAHSSFRPAHSVFNS